MCGWIKSGWCGRGIGKWGSCCCSISGCRAGSGSTICSGSGWGGVGGTFGEVELISGAL